MIRCSAVLALFLTLALFRPLSAEDEIIEDDDGNAIIRTVVKPDGNQDGQVTQPSRTDRTATERKVVDDRDREPPRRPSIPWTPAMFARTFSLGGELAKRVEYSYTNPFGDTVEWEPDVNDVIWFGGFSMRIFFSGSNWGIGFEGLYLDSAKIDNSLTYASQSYAGYGYYGNVFKPGTVTWFVKWLWDIDILFRIPIVPKLLVNGGAGLTMEAVTWVQEDLEGVSTDSGIETGEVGFNWKIGVEYFLDDVWSVTFDWKWQRWDSGNGKESTTIASLVGGIHMSF